MRVPLRTAGTLQGLHRGTHHPSALTEQQLAERLPGFVPGKRSVLWLEEQSLDPRDLCLALPLAAAAAGVKLLERTRVTKVEAAEDGVRVYATSSDEHATSDEQAWSARPLPALLRRPGRQRPCWMVLRCRSSARKGQMLAVELPAEGPSLDCVLRTPELYLVPRGKRDA